MVSVIELNDKVPRITRGNDFVLGVHLVENRVVGYRRIEQREIEGEVTISEVKLVTADKRRTILSEGEAVNGSNTWHLNPGNNVIINFYDKLPIGRYGIEIIFTVGGLDKRFYLEPGTCFNVVESSPDGFVPAENVMTYQADANTGLGTLVDLSGYPTNEQLTSALNSKVDKEEGKGLSENDFTDEYKDALDGMIENGSTFSTGEKVGKLVAGREATDRKRIDKIVEILKYAVFTSNLTYAFAELDDLANNIDSISFNVSTYKFTNHGDKLELGIVTDPIGKTVQVTWATSNAAVATVNNGVVTAIADGDTIISATTEDGKVAVCNIKVATIVINSVSLNEQSITLDGNDASKTLFATTNPSGYENGVQWHSDNTSVAIVDNSGKVTAVANGSTVIRASIGGKSATCKVTVTNVMQTFYVNVGILTNVTLEDEQGHSITDGRGITEGSTLTIIFVPAISYEISALTVVMGNTTFGLTDATDGIYGKKIITIQEVSCDITISASATYIRANLINNATKMENYGVIYRQQGLYGSNANYNCFIVPLEFGKRYEVDGYDWKAKNGASGGFNLALVKSDGNGGFTNVVAGTDIPDINIFNQVNTIFDTSNNVYFDTSTDFRERFFVTIPPISYFDQSVGAVYLAINARFSKIDISNDISIYEYQFGNEYSTNDVIENYGLVYSTYQIRKNTNCNVVIIKVEKGATYTYTGMNWSERGANGQGFVVGLLKNVGGSGEIVDNLKAEDFKNGAEWLLNDTYFNHSDRIYKSNPQESATFTVPTAVDLANDVDLFIAITTKFTNTDISNNINLIKQ